MADVPRRLHSTQPEPKVVILGKYGKEWHLQVAGRAHQDVLCPSNALAEFNAVNGIEYEEDGMLPFDGMDECMHGIPCSEQCDSCASWNLAGYMGRQMLDRGQGPAEMRRAMLSILGKEDGEYMARNLLGAPVDFSID